MPDVVFSNIGKLLLATQIYDMHRIAHHVSGGLIVSLPGPDEDHNPVTSAKLADVLRGRADIPYDKRIEVARFIEDLTASNQGGWYSVISLHGGGSPEAMKREIFRNYPLGNKVDLVERLLERGVLADPGRKITRNRQPGACCDSGCRPMPSAAPQMVPMPKPAEARRKARPAAAKLVRTEKPVRK
jgi:4-hydroxybutyryl-CoA dehydratase / vinylacetyl-CoA-Delta-isomerase